MSATVTGDELAGIRTSTRAHLDELLEEPGIVGDVGTLTVRAVWHSEIPRGEVWVAVLDRPGHDAPQVACVTLETAGDELRGVG